MGIDLNYTKFDNEIKALAAKSNPTGNQLNQKNSIFGLQGYPDVLGITNSIFAAAGNPLLPNAGFLGSTELGSNGMPSLDFKAITGLSSGKEEQMVETASSSAVNTVLNIKIPPLPAK